MMRTFDHFASMFGGKIVKVEYCHSHDGMGTYITPCCIGHAVIEVPMNKFEAACEEADAWNNVWNNDGTIDIEIIEENEIPVVVECECLCNEILNGMNVLKDKGAAFSKDDLEMLKNINELIGLAISVWKKGK